MIFVCTSIPMGKGRKDEAEEGGKGKRDRMTVLKDAALQDI